MNTSKTFTRKIDAEQFLVTMESSKAQGTWVDPLRGQVRLRDYANEWLASKANVTPRTLINLDGRLRNHVLPALGDFQLAAIEPANVRRFVADLTKRELAGSTIKAIYQALSTILNTAVIDGLIARSPCIGIKLPRISSKSKKHFLDADQVERLAEAIDPRYRALIYTAAYTGMRAGEIEALQLDSINLLRRTIDVVSSTSEIRGALVVRPTTKTYTSRRISIPRFLATMLMEHLERYPSSSHFVFTASGGGPIRHRNFYRRHFKPSVTRATLPTKLRFHDLRGTCVALLIAQGAHPKEIQERLGHSTIKMTLDQYGHLFPSLEARLTEGLEETFRRGAAASSRPGADKCQAHDADREPDQPPDQGLGVERTTGFEPATLTLAR